ncbi:EAL domain-containing protein [Paenibacillus nanensis]|uniref:EAL domain-containing protein n=2 Tax=Paenibacillus nanensis TaxID=393251 RepID=A0A3A1UM54_9BACL|nr:EAL domain-containing protein [Paenibacillus nanensis]
MIYFSWQWKGQTEGEWPSPELQERWRLAAERETDKVLRSVVLRTVRSWKCQDLFLSIDLPDGKQGIWESWLSQLAHELGSSISSAVRAETLPFDPSPPGLLLIGTAAVNRKAFLDEDCLWYEASKKAMLQGQFGGGYERGVKRKALERILNGKQIYPVYQPIISVNRMEIFGFEALTRLHDANVFKGPLELFQFAGEEEKMYSLEKLARELSIDGCQSLKPNQKLFINVMAQIMEDPGFSPGQTIDLLEKHHLSPEQVVFEITERSSIEDFPSVKKTLEHYRNQGYQIAIDDVGAGYSSLQSVVELRPDYLKVDRSIISHIHQDDVKKHVLHTLQEVGAKLGVSLIAEGIEQQEELDVLTQMGIPYAQGYLLGRPAPFPT